MKNYALDKKEIYKTVGGIKPQAKITATDDEVIKMLQMEQVEGLPSIYDDDSKYHYRTLHRILITFVSNLQILKMSHPQLI